MGRDVQTELDALHGKVDALARMVGELQGRVAQTGRGTTGEEPAGGPPFPRAALWQATEHLAQRAAELQASGLVRYGGCYTGADGREYRWRREQMAEDLLGQDDDMVARVLAALGHKQRLALLKAILERPAPTAELIERLGLTSAGQAYHHLNTLAAAGLIRQAERGQFTFVGYQAPAFLTLLAGVWSMLYTDYGTGTWSERSEPSASGESDGPLEAGMGGGSGAAARPTSVAGQ